MAGKVYVASMNMRGKWADEIEKSIKVNVTSAQGKNSKNRLAFSPMSEIENGYKGYWNFESYWQSGKVYQDIPFERTQKWWKELKEPKRRYPRSKGKKVLYAVFDNFEENMDYITSRKKIYVPEYYNLIKNKEQLLYLQNKLENGNNITIYDFDGPRTDDGDIMCLELTTNLLINKLNDVKYPFGHGYIVAATINNIMPESYINPYN